VTAAGSGPAAALTPDRGAGGASPLLAVHGLRVTQQRPGAARRDLVREVSFGVGRGEIVCVVGESGSGKSLSVKAVMGLLGDGPLHVGGDIEFDGRKLLELPADQRRAMRGTDMAMVFQEPLASLDPVMRVGAQVAESVRRVEPLRPRQAVPRVLELLRHVGLPDVQRVARSYPHQLSGGMCQRVMIAMALAARPKLLIADEPTSALDVTVQAQILDLLTRMRDEEAMSILLVTHDLSVAAAIADSVIVMYAGRTVEVAPASELFGRARHPYTAGLLRSLPQRGAGRSGRLVAIGGTVPEPGQLPAGCAFSPRCDKTIGRCSEQDPPLEWSGRSAAACWVANGHD
jgi:oligopeptide/dipeptide ABC transporter ATP-binding protein